MQRLLGWILEKINTVALAPTYNFCHFRLRLHIVLCNQGRGLAPLRLAESSRLPRLYRGFLSPLAIHLEPFGASLGEKVEAKCKVELLEQKAART